MLVLVSGGAASGKSEYAESLALSNAPCTYLATMEVWDEEDRRRVERHRHLRQGKGFATLECPRNLSSLVLPEGGCLLLECLSNLCANECFGPEGMKQAAQRILQGIAHLQAHTDCLIVVTNELFSDGIPYEKETMDYLQILSYLNRTLAERADAMVEVVCGIPVVWKGCLE